MFIQELVQQWNNFINQQKQTISVEPPQETKPRRTYRDWFWNIPPHGPDFLFYATFRPEDALRLREAIRAFSLDGYVREIDEYYANESKVFRAKDVKLYDWYSDEHNYKKLVSRRSGSGGGNIYVYCAIYVEDNKLTIERGYGGYGPELGDIETALLLQLAKTQDIEILDWSIVGGGQGYRSHEVASGNSNESLDMYLRPCP